ASIARQIERTDQKPESFVAIDALHKTLLDFFHTARHLWGRCPRCDNLFRLSDVAISSGTTAPADWLQRLETRQGEIECRQADLDQQHAELQLQEAGFRDRERNLTRRERNIEELSRSRALA